MSFFQKLNNFIYLSSSVFSMNIEDFVDLETVVKEKALVSKDLSYCTVVKLDGMFRMADTDIFTQFINSFESGIGSSFKDKGHILQVVMTYDPDGSSNDIYNSVSPIKNTAKNFGINADSILDDYAKSVIKYSAFESIYLVLWTTPSVLNKEQMENAENDRKERISKKIFRSYSQEEDHYLSGELENKHASFISSVTSVLSNLNYRFNVLNGRNALEEIRYNIDPEFTSKNWTPMLPGDEKWVFEKEEFQRKNDERHILGYPRISTQLFPREPKEIDDNILQIGNRYFYPVEFSELPVGDPPFNDFFRKAVLNKTPFQISFMIKGGGVQGQSLKSFLGKIANFGINKSYVEALKGVQEMENEGVSIGTLQINAMTWAKFNKSEENTLKELRVNASDLISICQGWGKADIKDVNDPMLGFISCVPAISKNQSGSVGVGPLRSILGMMPFVRPARIWKEGSFLTRTKDGKFTPYKIGSSEQAYWVTLGEAPMGYGKSVNLNTENFAFVFQEGLNEFPYITTIDIGKSSKGLISLIRNLLPENKKYLAKYYRIRMDERYSINIFDTLLGARYPTVDQKNYLINMLSLFNTPLDEESPMDGVSGISEMVIDMAYNEYSDEKNPKLYEPNTNEKIDSILEKYEYVPDENTTWWEIVDFLFIEKKEPYLASIAQRYAVPVLSEIAGFAKRKEVQIVYDIQTKNGESLIDFFWRHCIEATKRYPILKNPTRLDVSQTKIMALDLDEVAPKGGAEAKRQTGVMYMMARHLGVSRFYVSEDDAYIAPKPYHKFHEKRIKSINEIPKKIAYDECHRFIGQSSVSKQIVGDIETIIRESRKWMIFLDLYSQDIYDFPPVIRELASKTYFMGSVSRKKREKIEKDYGLSTVEAHALETIGKPNKSGSTFLIYMKLSSNNYVQLLSNTIGNKMLIAFSSTREDSVIRDRLYERIGVERTLEIISRKYPNGLKEEVDNRKHLYAEKGLNINPYDKIIEELVKESISISLN